MVDEFGAGMHVVVRKNMGMVYSDGNSEGWKSIGLVYGGGKWYGLVHDGGKEYRTGL
jgi:hypothetical protein